MNLKRRAVEIRTSEHTAPGALQKGDDFVRAFTLGPPPRCSPPLHPLLWLLGNSRAPALPNPQGYDYNDLSDPPS